MSGFLVTSAAFHQKLAIFAISETQIKFAC